VIRPQPPVGLRRLCHQNSPRCYSHLLIYIDRSAFLALKITQSNKQQMLGYVFASSPLLCLFFTSNFKKDDKYLAPPEIFFASLVVLGWLRPWLKDVRFQFLPIDLAVADKTCHNLAITIIWIFAFLLKVATKLCTKNRKSCKTCIIKLT